MANLSPGLEMRRSGDAKITNIFVFNATQGIDSGLFHHCFFSRYLDPDRISQIQIDLSTRVVLGPFGTVDDVGLSRPSSQGSLLISWFCIIGDVIESVNDPLGRSSFTFDTKVCDAHQIACRFMDR